MGLIAASGTDDRLTQLMELRNVLAVAIEDCESNRDLAALTRQYRETIREIDEIKGNDNDDDAIATIILRRRQSGTDKSSVA